MEKTIYKLEAEDLGFVDGILSFILFWVCVFTKNPMLIVWLSFVWIESLRIIKIVETPRRAKRSKK